MGFHILKATLESRLEGGGQLWESILGASI